MNKFNYKQFLEKLNISLDYTYMLNDDILFDIDKSKEEFINNLLLVPNVTDDSKQDLLKKVIENRITQEEINNILIKIEDIFLNFDSSINDSRVKIRK